MPKIQIDLSEEEDRLVEIYKLSNKLKTKQNAIKKMINYFEVKIIPKKISNEEYYRKSVKFSEDKK